MLPVDASSTRGGSTSVRRRVRSAHISGGRPAAGSQRADSLGSCATQPACYSLRRGRQTDGSPCRLMRPYDSLFCIRLVGNRSDCRSRVRSRSYWEANRCAEVGMYVPQNRSTSNRHASSTPSGNRALQLQQQPVVTRQKTDYFHTRKLTDFLTKSSNNHRHRDVVKLYRNMPSQRRFLPLADQPLTPSSLCDSCQSYIVNLTDL